MQETISFHPPLDLFLHLSEQPVFPSELSKACISVRGMDMYRCPLGVCYGLNMSLKARVLET